MEGSKAKSNAKRTAGVMVGLALGIFLSALDQTVLNVAIPKLSLALNGFEKSAWIITSYLLFATIATPVSGKLADIYGVRPVLIASTGFFTLASGLCGLAGLQSPFFGLSAIDQLILLRALQGIAGGAMIGLCFVAIGDLYPARERGKYQGYLAAAFVTAAIVGPLTGGWLTENYTWRAIFLLNIPFGILATLIIAMNYGVTSREKAPAVIDYAGICFLIAFLIPLLLAASEIGALGSLSVSSSIELAISVVAFISFVWAEKRAREPLIPLTLFNDRLISISLLTVFISGICLFGSMLLIAIMLQQMADVTATASGAMLIPLMLVVAVASVLGGLSIAKTGRYKLLCIVALALLIVGTALLRLFSSGNSPWLFLAAATTGGVGLGLLLPVHSIIVQNKVAGANMGVATSMTQLFRSLGGTIGTGLMSALMLSLLKQSTLEQAIAVVLNLYLGCLIFTLILNFFMPEEIVKKAELGA